jgi:hypothetical protein
MSKNLEKFDLLKSSPQNLPQHLYLLRELTVLFICIGPFILLLDVIWRPLHNYLFSPVEYLLTAMLGLLLLIKIPYLRLTLTIILLVYYLLLIPNILIPFANYRYMLLIPNGYIVFFSIKLFISALKFEFKRS